MSRLKDQRREIHGMDLAVAEQALAERRRTLFELRLQKERGEVKNNRQFPQLKKEIARLLQHITELHNLGLSEVEATRGDGGTAPGGSPTPGGGTAPASPQGGVLRLPDAAEVDEG